MLRASAHLLRWLGVVVITAAMLGAAAIGGLAWRLAQGPLPLDSLARAMEAYANRDEGPVRVLIGSAALAWEGFDIALDRPLEVLVEDVRLIDEAGIELAGLPEGRVSLGLRSLLLGRFEPRAIDVSGIRLAVLRAEDGALSLDLGTLAELPAGPQPHPAGEGGAGATAEGFAALLAEFGLAPLPEGAPRPRFGELQRVRVREATVEFEDRQLGGRWSVPGARLDLRRRPQAGGTALLLDAAGTAEAGEARLPLRLAATLRPEGSAEGSVVFGPVRPAEVAQALPILAPLAAVEAPLSGTVELAREAAGGLASARLRARLGEGTIAIPETLAGEPSSVPVTEADLAVRYANGTVTLERLAVTLPGAAGPSPTLTATGTGTPREDGSWSVAAEARVDRVAAADLPRLWPKGLGRNERAWITANITDGMARDAAVSVRATIPAGLDDIVPEAVDGTLRAEGVTVHYLRPMPPVEGVAATLALGLSEITIEASGGRLGEIRVPEARIRLYDLDRRPNLAAISLRIETSVEDAISLVSHPKLDLIGRRGAPPPGITGRGEVRLEVAFPLIDALDIDTVDVTASATATDVRVPAILAGRDLEKGVFELSVDREALRLSGTGSFGPVAAQLRGEMDFRAGPATQVIERYSARFAPQEGIDALFDIDLAPALTGPVGGEATLEVRRNGQGSVAARADLAPARLSLPLLGLEKPPGAAGTAELRLSLAPGGRLTSAEVTRLEAGPFSGRARFGLGRNGRLERVEIPEARLGESRASGTLAIPADRGAPLALTLRSPVVVLPSHLPKPGETADSAEGRPVAIDAQVDRIVVAPGRELAAIRGTATIARSVITSARFTARVGDRGQVTAEVTPQGTRRALSIQADDAGALLHALDVFDTMAGGTLSVRGSYDDAVAGSPLTGEAEIRDFRMREAPAAARVLQAMTLYGIADLARGPGVAFNRAIASFTLTDEAVEFRDARAYGASLGFTAKGRIDRDSKRLDLEGTIVPAYYLNTLLGNIPIIGRIFSPEQGGGVFAATYRVRGPVNDPEVSVNPLAALTPGFLRGLFGVFEGGSAPAGMPPSDVPEHERGG